MYDSYYFVLVYLVGRRNFTETYFFWLGIPVRSGGAVVGRRGVPMLDISVSRRRRDLLKELNDESRLSWMLRRLAKEEREELRRLAVAREFLTALNEVNGEICRLAGQRQTVTLGLLEEVCSERHISSMLRGAVALCFAAALWPEPPEAVCCAIEDLGRRVIDAIAHEAKNGGVSSNGSSVAEGLLRCLEALLEKDRVEGDSSSKYVLSSRWSHLAKLLLDILEATEGARTLAAAIRLLHEFNRQPERARCFGTHFESAADILIGWHIETHNQEEWLVQTVNDCMLNFAPFWQASASFSRDMLRNLADDIDTYTRQEVFLVKDSKERDRVDKSVLKIALLLRVFGAVFRGLTSDQKVPSLEQDILAAYVTQMVGNARSIRQSLLSEALLVAANHTLAPLVELVEPTASPTCTEAFGLVTEWLAEQLQPPKPNHISQCPSFEYLRSLTTLTRAALGRLAANPPTTFPAILYRCFGPESLLHTAKLSPNPGVARGVLATFQTVLNCWQADVLDALYQIAISDLEVCCTRLLRLAGSEAQVHLVQQNGFESKDYEAGEAEALLIFNCLLVAEVGRLPMLIDGSKHASLVHLTPGVLDLCLRYLPLADVALMSAYPDAHLAFLQVQCTIVGGCRIAGHL